MEPLTTVTAQGSDLTGDVDARPTGVAAWFRSPHNQVALLAVAVLIPTLLVLAALPGRDVSYVDKGWLIAPIVLAMFVASEPLVFHVEARNEAVSFSPTDLPLALGLLMLSPLTLVAARIVGAGIGLLIWRRQPLFKLTLNLSAFASETLIAVLVFRLLFDGIEQASGWLWIGMIASLMVGLLCAGIVIATAIAFFEGGIVGRIKKELSHSYLYYLPGAMLGASFAIPMLVEPWLVALFLTPAPLVWFILRSHGSLQHRYADLTNVHEFSSQVGGASHVDEIAETAVTEIASHLRAGAAALVVWDPTGGSVRASVGDPQLLAALPAAASEVPWDLEAASSEPFVVDADDGDAKAAWLTELGGDHALVVILRAEDMPIGLLVATDRQGVGRRFDEDDRARLRPISDQLAVALRKGQLHVQIQHDATHDRLTDLPNRAYFEAWMEQTLIDDDVECLAILLLDLDRFKEVNDTLGHHAGDEILVEVAHRLRTCLGADDFPARFGGDEYAIVATGAGADEATLLAERISVSLDRPFELGESQVAIAASIGVALSPEHGRQSSDLLRRADLAMYDAKRRHARWSTYSGHLEGQDSVRLAMLGDLRDALDHETLEVHFQPKVDLRTGKVVGVEALSRWEHPAHGVVSPEIFIPLAEQAGLIEDVTELILRTSLAQVRRLVDLGFDLDVAVNLSPQSLLNEDLPRRVLRLLERSGVPGSRLTFEITEQTVIGDVPRTVRILAQLHELGVKISIDDFGTGHSSLTNLRHLPISELKIDRSFVVEMLVGNNDEVIVKSTIDLGHNLGYHVVAEGVETPEVLERLRGLGCDLAQGFGVCRPLSADKLERWLTTMRIAPVDDLMDDLDLHRHAPRARSLGRGD